MVVDHFPKAGDVGKVGHVDLVARGHLDVEDKLVSFMESGSFDFALSHPDSVAVAPSKEFGVNVIRVG